MANNKYSGYTPKYTSNKRIEGSTTIDNRLEKYNPFEFRKGMDYELTELGCSRLAESSPEEREKATEKVLKNLDKHPGYYSALIQYEVTYRNNKSKPNFNSWLKEFTEEYRMKEIGKKYSYKNTQLSKSDAMEEPKYNKKEYTLDLKEAIKNELKYILRENEEDFDDDDEKADKAASKSAKKASKGGNRFDLEKEAIKDLLYRGKKGKDSEYTEEEPAPKSILDVKNQMLQLYKSKYKGKEGGVDSYNAELVKANEKFFKILEKHVKVFGEEGKGNAVTMENVYGEKLSDTIKLLGIRLKDLEKEEEAELITRTNERRQVAQTDMTREQHIKLLEIIRENGISLREGAQNIKVYYEIAKASYLEGLSNGLGI